ncbi:MAG: OBAP family protein [Terriglobales bacterium]
MHSLPRLTLLSLAAILAVFLTAGCNTKNTAPKAVTEGGDKSGKTEVLEAGAKALQSTTPIGQIDIYLVGFHPMKDNPPIQMEAHHYCHQMNEDFAQCVLFDGNTKDAQMNGIEYIISEKLYDTLPEKEKQYWHPHNYEILSGQLDAPGLPETAEHSLMSKKMNSYGKTWHVWMTDSNGKPMDKLPLGTPHLAWSFNHDGESVPGLVEARDKRMGIDSAKKRKEREDLAQYAHPQGGVDDLKKAFPKASGAPKGVQDIKETPHGKQ